MLRWSSISRFRLPTRAFTPLSLISAILPLISPLSCLFVSLVPPRFPPVVVLSLNSSLIFFCQMDLDANQSTLEGEPTNPTRRSYWVLRLVRTTILCGGHLTPKLYVPMEVWAQVPYVLRRCLRRCFRSFFFFASPLPCTFSRPPVRVRVEYPLASLMSRNPSE